MVNVIELTQNIYKNGDLVVDNNGFYAQSKQYNYDLGGVPRKFKPIESKILKSKLLNNLIYNNILLAKQSNKVDFNKKINIGIHQVRYFGSSSSPSYASPLWLHRDDENLVFIHLVNLSLNCIGGNNLISYEPNKIKEMVYLKHPLDTLLVTKDHLHAVTPIGSNDNKKAYRDILLITFDNELDITNRI